MNNNKFNNLLNNIIQKKITVGVIGLGYVGLPLALRFSEEKFNVIGFDVDNDKTKKLNNKKSYIKHISDKSISKMIHSGFKATTDFKNIEKVQAIIICVPTPLGIHNEPDLTFIFDTLDLIKNHLKKMQILILESTTYPGTTEEEILPYLNSHKKFKIGKDFFIGYSPEREDPGNKEFNTKNIPKIVSGVSKNCLKIVEELYKKIVDKTVPVSSTKVAEMTKILENIHRAVNIGLVNELKILSDKMDINIYEAINAAATKPFGFTPYYPGPGLGGHCIPIDPFYLTWKAKELGMTTRFIELAGEINRNMPNYIIENAANILNDSGLSIKNSKILVLGLSYKKNVDDLRESPSLEIIKGLIDRGACVKFADPFFKTIPITRKYQINIQKANLTALEIKKYDLVILATDHDNFDYKMIYENSKSLLDTRGKFQSFYKNINK